MFSNKTLLITGGTGSFGNAVLKRFLDTDIKEIRIFSRDEKKQEDLRIRLSNSKLKFYIGDIRTYDGLYHAMNGVDYVFHAAALKQVPSCEFYPMEAIRTNVLGAENVLNAALENKVEKVFITRNHFSAAYIKNLIKFCNQSNIEIHILSSYEPFSSTFVDVENFDGIPFLTQHKIAPNRLGFIIKRMVDIIISLILLIISSPIFLFTIILIKTVSPKGPIFYFQKRVGKNNKVFKTTPVIMLSSKDGLFDRAKGRIVGSEQYLTKPFTKEELLGAIKKHVLT